MDEARNRAIHKQRGEYSVEYRIARSTGEVRWIEGRLFVSYGGDGRPERMVGVDIDVTGRKRAEEHQRMLVAELDHRVKNVLATVSAVASRTQDASVSVGDFAAKLAGRIQSMAATHELISSRDWKGISLPELVRRELTPYMSDNNTEIDGPNLTLSTEAGRTVSMVLHELTTNAAKHGALSNDYGRVSVQWNRAQNGNAVACLCIEWRETGGPPIPAPRGSGYGTEVIRDLIPYELGGTVDLVFAPEGLRCAIHIPVTQLIGSDRDANEQFVDPGRHEQELRIRAGRGGTRILAVVPTDSSGRESYPADQTAPDRWPTPEPEHLARVADQESPAAILGQMSSTSMGILASRVARAEQLLSAQRRHVMQFERRGWDAATSLATLKLFDAITEQFHTALTLAQRVEAVSSPPVARSLTIQLAE